MGPLALLGAATAALILTLLLGYLVLRAFTRLNEPECLALSGMAGVALVAGIAFLAFLFGTFSRWFYITATLCVIMLSLAIAWRRKTQLIEPILNNWLAALVILWLALLSMEFIVTVYAGAGWYGDWWMHFDIAQFYLGQRYIQTHYFGIYNISSRTPLFNLAESYFLATLGNNFAVYQVTSLIPSLAFWGVFFFLARVKRIGIPLFVVGFNPFIVTNALYPWPKLLASAYVLASLYFYLYWRSAASQIEKKNLVAWGLCTGLAILAHPSTLFYGVGMILDFLWLHRRNINWSLRQIAMATIIVLAVVIPWLAWVAQASGLEVLLQSTPVLVRQSEPISLATWGIERLWNAVGTLFPGTLAHTLYERVIVAAPGGPERDLWDALRRFYYSVLPGAFTNTLTLVVLLGLVKRFWVQRVSMQTVTLPWILVISGFMGGILLQPGQNRSGLAAESMAPLVLLFLLFAVRIIREATPRFKRLILIMAVLEFLASRGTHTAILALNLVDVGDPNVILKLEQGLIFARDMVGAVWPVFGIIALVSYALIALAGFRESLATEVR